MKPPRTIRNLVIAIFFICCHFMVSAQNSSLVDSLFKQAEFSSNLKTKSVYYNQIVTVLYGYSEKSKIASLRLLQIGKKLQDPEIMATAYNNLGFYYHGVLMLDSMLKCYNLAEAAAEKSDSKSILVKTIVRIGNFLMDTKQYDDAEFYYNKAFKIANDNGVLSENYHIYNNLGLLKRKTEHYQESVELFNKYFSTLDSTNYVEIGRYYHNIAWSHFYLNDTYTAYREMVLSMKYRYKTQNMSYYSESIYSMVKMVSEKKNYAFSGIKLPHKLPAKANLLLDTVIYFGNTLHAIELSKLAYNLSIEIAVANKDYKKAYKSQKALVQLTNKYGSTPLQLDALAQIKLRLADEKNRAQVAILEAEAKAKKLEANRQKQNVIILSIIGISLLIIIFSLVLYNKQRLKNKNLEMRLKQDKINALEKENQVKVLESMLNGQETERQRIAKELHDGIGNLLSGIQLKINNLKPQNTNNQSFENITEIIDLVSETAVETRRISHNMMPATLLKFGLAEALRELCQRNNSESTKFHFELFGSSQKLNETLEINLYRICQESFQNIHKHARATDVFVQLSLNSTSVHLTIEDNGIGFDAQNIKNGIGLDSIKTRVKSLSGVFLINSQLHKGTTIEIEIEL